MIVFRVRRSVRVEGVPDSIVEGRDVARCWSVSLPSRTRWTISLSLLLGTIGLDDEVDQAQNRSAGRSLGRPRLSPSGSTGPIDYGARLDVPRVTSNTRSRHPTIFPARVLTVDERGRARIRAPSKVVGLWVGVWLFPCCSCVPLPYLLLLPPLLSIFLHTTLPPPSPSSLFFYFLLFPLRNVASCFEPVLPTRSTLDWHAPRPP